MGPGAYAVGTHAVLGLLRGNTLRESMVEALGATVGRIHGLAHVPGFRARSHDVAARLFELGQRGPAHVKGGVDVVLNHVLEGLNRVLVELRGRRKCRGIVYQNVELAKLPHGRLHAGFGYGLASQVALKRGGPAAARRDFFDHGLHRVFGQAGHQHGGAFLGKFFGDGLADTRARARYDSHFTLKSVHSK